MMELIILMNDEQGKSIRDRLYSHLNSLPEREKLRQILGILDSTTEMDEQLSELVWEAWDYLQTHELWRCQYRTLEALQSLIGYKETLKHIIEKHEVLEGRIWRETQGIFKNWGKLPHE